jgi:predicted MFS family arabinose efflux permease
MVWVGDSVPFARRQSVLTDLNAATALGITSAIGLGGLLATVSWRLGFLLPAVLAGVLAVLLRRLPEPSSTAASSGRWRLVLGDRTARLVLLLALVEGAALLGLLTYLPPAAESAGASPTTAGLLVALYGVGLLLTSRVVKRRAGRTGAPVFVGLGALGLAVAYGAVAVSQAPLVIGLAALVVGAGWAALHSTMQAWATEAVPAGRAVMVSLFAAMLFVGSGTLTSLLAPLAGDLRWGPLFASGVALAAVFGVAAVASLRAAARQAGGGQPPYA